MFKDDEIADAYKEDVKSPRDVSRFAVSRNGLFRGRAFNGVSVIQRSGKSNHAPTMQARSMGGKAVHASGRAYKPDLVSARAAGLLIRQARARARNIERAKQRAIKSYEKLQVRLRALDAAIADGQKVAASLRSQAIAKQRERV